MSGQKKTFSSSARKIRKKVIRDPSIDESYIRIEHPCGLLIQISQKPFQTCCATLRVLFGEMHTQYRLKGRNTVHSIPRGTAHFLEHKMFEDENGNDLFNAFAENGGDANAYTGWEETTYYFSCVSRFRENLRILLSMVATPSFTEESVEREKGIIREELSSYLDDPWNAAFVSVKRNLYRKLNIRFDLGGSERTIRHITPACLKRVHRLFYRPSNMVLGICGNPGQVNVEEVIRLVDEVFGTERTPGEYAEPVIPKEPADILRKASAVRGPVPAPYLYFGLKYTSRPSMSREKRLRDSLVMDIAEDCLFSGSSDLQNDLLENRLIQGTLNDSSVFSKAYGLLTVSACTGQPEEVLHRILDTVKKALEEGFEAEEVARNRKAAIASVIQSFDTSEGVAEMMAKYGNPRCTVFDMLRVYAGVTPEECLRVLKGTVDRNRYTSVRLLPSGEPQPES
ncbi:MAG: insulinase family protein [Clostridia bacterium]|nr:insulinase family protein [Clostridia bacterium]